MKKKGKEVEEDDVVEPKGGKGDQKSHKNNEDQKQQQVSSNEFYRPFDKTTVDGTYSSIGENPQNNRPHSHQSSNTTELPEDKRLPNTRKPMKKQPPKSSTYQELMQSYYSDQGILPFGQKKKQGGMGGKLDASFLLQGILERHNLNRTEQQILLTNIIGQSIDSRNINNQSRNQAHGDDDEEIKNPRFEEDESPQIVQQNFELIPEEQIEIPQNPLEEKKQEQQIPLRMDSAAQNFLSEQLEGLPPLQAVQNFLGSIYDEFQNEHQHATSAQQPLLQESHSFKLESEQQSIHHHALLTAIRESEIDQDTLLPPIPDPTQQPQSLRKSKTTAKIVQINTEMLDITQSPDKKNHQIIIKDDQLDLPQKEVEEEINSDMGEYQHDEQQIVVEIIEENREHLDDDNDDSDFKSHHTLVMNSHDEEDVHQNHDDDAMDQVKNENDYDMEQQIMSRSDTEEYKDNDDDDDDDDGEESPSEPMGSKAQRYNLRDTHEEVQVLVPEKAGPVSLASLESSQKSQTSEQQRSMNSLNNNPISREGTMVLRQSTESQQILRRQETSPFQEPIITEQSMLHQSSPEIIELKNLRVSKTLSLKQNEEIQEKDEENDDDDEDLNQIEECVNSPKELSILFLDEQNNKLSSSPKKEQQQKPFFLNVFGPDKKNRYQKQDTGNFAASMIFQKELEMQELTENPDQLIQQLEEERKSLIPQKPQNALTPQMPLTPLSRSTISQQIMGLNIKENAKIDYCEFIGHFNLNLLTIKSKKINKKRCKPIEPDSSFKTSWDLLGLFMILYEAVVIPYRVTYNMQSSGFLMLFELIIDTFFIFDVLINLYTGYYKKGVLVQKRRHIMCRYLKTWFIIDLLASIPFSWFISEQDLYDDNGELMRNDAVVHHTSQLLRLLKIVRFMRIIRLIRLFKLPRLVNRFEEVFFNDTVSMFMGILKVMLVIFYLVHWAACLFFYISEIQRFEGNPSWIEKFGIDKLQPFDQYIASVHWSLTTMTTVGYGDIFPMNVVEIQFAIFCEILACGVFAYIIGSLSSIIDHKAALLIEFKEKTMQINDFMIFNKLPTDFRIKVRHYMNYVYDNKKKYKLEEEDVLLMLNDNLRVETTVHLNGKLLNETPLFKTFDVTFLAQLTFVIKKRIFVIDEHIFNEGDRGESLFYIQKGTVILIHRKSRTFIKELAGDDFMGECAFFSGEPRSASARSKNFTDVIVLFKNDFIQTTDDFPKAYQTLLDIQNKIKFKRDFSQIGVKCYICDRLGHISVECPEFYTWHGNQDMLTQSHDGKLIVRKSHDSYGHKMPKITRNLPSLGKQFKEDLPFEINHFDDIDSSYQRNGTSTFPELKQPPNNERLSTYSRFGKSILDAPGMGIHKIDEQSEENIDEDQDFKGLTPKIKHKAQSDASGYSEEDEGEELLKKTQGLQQKKGLSTWNQHTMKPSEQQELQQFLSLVKDHDTSQKRDYHQAFFKSDRRHQQSHSPDEQLTGNDVSDRSGFQQRLLPAPSDRSQIRASQFLTINEIYQNKTTSMKKEGDGGYQIQVDIGKKILNEIGMSKAKQGDFVNVISNNKQLMNPTQMRQEEKKRKKSILGNLVLFDHSTNSPQQNLRQTQAGSQLLNSVDFRTSSGQNFVPNTSSRRTIAQGFNPLLQQPLLMKQTSEEKDDPPFKFSLGAVNNDKGRPSFGGGGKRLRSQSTHEQNEQQE